MGNKTSQLHTGNTILDKILKRILKVPFSTPREALYIETGLLDPEHVIKKNRISMESRIRNGNNQTMKKIMELKHKGAWAEQNRELKKETNISDEDIMGTKYQLRKQLKNNINYKFEHALKSTAESKSKMKYYMEGKQKWKIGERAKYISQLTRNQASTIFKTRTRMLKTKSNYKNGHKDLNCRLCGKEEETQQHVLEKCEQLVEIETITKEMVFQEDTEKLKETVKLIDKRMEMLEKMPNQ